MDPWGRVPMGSVVSRYLIRRFALASMICPQLVISKLVVPNKWAVHGRTSFVFGQFGNSYEYAWCQVISHSKQSSCLARRRGPANRQASCFIGDHSLQLGFHRLGSAASVDVQLLTYNRIYL